MNKIKYKSLNRLLVILALFVLLAISCKTVPIQEKNQNNIINIKSVSERWKENHDINDFNLLKNTIKNGDGQEFVLEILGEPLNKYQSDDKREFWLYIKCDLEKKQYYAWTLIFDKDKKVIEWYKKGIE